MTTVYHDLAQSGAELNAALAKIHSQNTDTSLDLGGANPVTAEELVTLRDMTVPAKANKAASPTAGNLASLDVNGNLVDSGVARAAITSSFVLESQGAYGIMWNPADDTYHELGAGNGSPVQAAMVRCLLKNSDGTLDSALAGGGLLDAEDSTLLGDGTTNASTYINGSLGHQVMSRIPKAYTSLYEDSRGCVWMWCCDKPLPGLTLHPAFMVHGTEQTYRYIGSYQSVRYSHALTGYVDGAGDSRPADLANDYIGSVSGFIPLTNQYRSDFRTLSQNIGPANIFQWDWFVYDLMRILFFTDKATRSAAQPLNSQAVLPGHTEDGSWDFAKVLSNGLTNVLGNASGSVEAVGTTGKAANSFRGIENFYGSIWKWLDGFNVNTNIPYYCNVPAQFADDTVTNYTRFVDQYDAPITLPAENNYQKHLWPGTLLPFSVGGGADSASYLTDYYYQNTGWRVLCVGGFLSFAGFAGASDLAASYSSSLARSDVGSRLAASEE